MQDKKQLRVAAATLVERNITTKRSTRCNSDINLLLDILCKSHWERLFIEDERWGQYKAFNSSWYLYKAMPAFRPMSHLHYWICCHPEADTNGHIPAWCDFFLSEFSWIRFWGKCKSLQLRKRVSEKKINQFSNPSWSVLLSTRPLLVL